MLLNPVRFHTPKNLKEAATLLESLEEVKILAGGTFLLNSLKLLKRKGSKTPKNILSLSKIPELKGTRLDNDRLIIKAMTTINDLFADASLVDNFAVLKTVCRNISTNPIRNMATVGGNLTCRYTWTEMGAVMMALDADLVFVGTDGKEETISAEAFFKNAARSSKIFAHVSIPRDAQAVIAYRRVKKTMHVDIPLLATCVKTNIKNNTFHNTRVAINNGTAFAQRDYTLEKFLEGKSPAPSLAEEALDHLDTTIYDKRSDEYKQHMFRTSLKSSIEEIVASKTP